MGHREFALRGHGLTPERAGIVGMSLLLGARGLGAFVGPLSTAPWAGHSQRRLQLGILFGYLAVAIGYALIGFAPNVWVACVCIAFGHVGGSTVWVFSTTLLQLRSDDRYRGRVFAADLGICMLSIAVGAFVCGRLADAGISPRVLVTGTGFLMLLPAMLWAWAMRLQRRSAFATAD